VIADSTRISVGTLAFRKHFIVASRLAKAGIVSTGVIIIARIDIVPFHDIGLVHFAVTIVIDAVADFLLRHRCITVCQAILRTEALALAGTDFVSHITAGPKGQFH